MKNSKNESKRKKNGSIQKKFCLTMLPVVGISILAIIIINYFQVNDMITQNVNYNLEEASEKNTDMIENWIVPIYSYLEGVVNTLENVEFTDEEMYAYLKTTPALNKNTPTGVYVGAEDGFYLNGSGFVPGPDYVVTQRGWYVDGLDNDTLQLGAPYVDADTGGYCVSPSIKLKNQKHPNFVLASDIFLDDMGKMIANADVMDSKSGYVFLVDSSSKVVIAHKDSTLTATEFSTNSADSFMAKAAEMIDSKAYEMKEIIQGKTTYLVSVEPVEGTTWVLYSCIDKGEVYAQLHQMQYMYFALAIIVLLLSTIIISLVIRTSVKPIHTLTDGLAKITKGDFTVQIKPEGNDEITRMSESLKTYIDYMNSVIANIRDITEMLETESKTSNTVSQTLNGEAKDQATSMQNMDSTVGQLAESIGELARNATTLAQLSSQTNDHGHNSMEKMQYTVGITETGTSDMKEVKRQMENIINSITELSTSVEAVGESTKQIHEILGMIQEIASQTNLLSLNASIEAARAGESGRGFAVVAGEIGKLAEDSTNATHQIEDIINKISQQTDEMVKQTHFSVSSIESNATSINTACDIFQNIYTNLSETSELLEAMISEVQKVDEVATSIAAISEEQSASADEILASADSLARSAENIATEGIQVEKSANTLSDTSILLFELMREFVIK